jgi:predicted HicB family RNase H-like nuclease
MCEDDWVKRVTVQLDDDLHKAAKLYAVEQDCSMNDLFVEAIRKHLKEKREEMYGDKP